MKNNELTIRKFFIDTTGLNYLIIKQNDKLISLYLKLGKLKQRFIGTVTKSTKTFEVRRKRGKHLHIKSNSYGFNYHALDNKKSFDTVRLSDEISDWKIPVNFILENGSFLYFKEQGFEKQIFVSLEQIEQYIVPPEEKRRF